MITQEQKDLIFSEVSATLNEGQEVNLTNKALDEIGIAMDKYASQEAQGFAEWAYTNYVAFAGRWRKKPHYIFDDDTDKTTEQLYQQFTTSREKK